jgi:eukaryotic-like serine/threonine-protein kinase
VTADRWAEVERLCHAALAVDPAMRAAYLDEACAGDAELRREVGSLLAQQSRAGGFLEVPVVPGADAGAAGRIGPPREPLPHGTRLGPYEIDALIGTGGMGEVYRARDTRLERTVALKILPEGLAADPDRRRRFEHEARAASALSHPHICALYDVGESILPNPESRTPNPVSVSYLVMEHLEGETLAARIARGPLPVPDVLAYGAQIAEALSAAHRGGIVHRDLKPANVMLLGSGGHRTNLRTVKLLDFGLAKLKSGAGAGASAEAVGAAPTSMTTPGQIVGTLPYMAPEQVEGRDADARTDIWALGAMLYEMVTGARAFQAATSASLTAAILEHEPAPISSTQPLTPPALDRLIRKCLAKDPDARWQSARDVADELQWLREPSATGSVSSAGLHPRRRRVLHAALVFAGALVLVTLGAGAMRLLRPSSPSASLAGLSIEVRPADEVNAGGRSTPVFTPGGYSTALTWTPDGQTLVFVGRRSGVQQLYLRRLGAAEATPLPDTDGAQVPAVSADGQWVAFWAGGSIRKVRLAGGPPQEIVPGLALPPKGMAWSDRGELFYAPYMSDKSEIWKVPVQGAPVGLTTAGDSFGQRMPWPLPGGRALLYTVRKRYWTWGDEEVVALPLPNGQPRILLTDAADARYLPTGHLVFLRRGTLYAVAFDAERLEVRGPQVALLGSVAQSISAWNADDISGAGQFAIATNGTLAWLRSTTVSPPSAELVAVDRAGRVVALPISNWANGGPDVWEVCASPDGRQLALTILNTQERGIWLYDLERHALRPLLRDGEAQWLAWSPDGRLFFYWLKDGRHSIAALPIDSDGNTRPQVFESGPRVVIPVSFDPQGSLVGLRDSREIVKITLADGQARVDPLHETRYAEGWPSISPDGRWLSYGASVSDPTVNTLQTEVYVRPFHGAGNAVLASVGGGRSPAWNPSGGELFYVTVRDPRGSASMMAVDFTPGNPPNIGHPRRLFDFDASELLSCAPARCFGVAPDGQHFYTMRAPKPPPPPAVTHINIVPNWFEELKAKVPASSK